MKHLLTAILLAFSFSLSAQCIIEVTVGSKTIFVPIDEMAYVVPSGAGASIVRQAGLQSLTVVESVDTIVGRCEPSLLAFTNAANGQKIAVSKTFIDRVLVNSQGKAVIQTKNARIAYVSFEDAVDIKGITDCYGMGSGGSGIDNSYSINDSVFITSGGDVYFTGIGGVINPYGGANTIQAAIDSLYNPLDNPYGGSNEPQSVIDSIYSNQNQIIVSSDSFYINPQDQPVYLVEAGDTITLPQAAQYTAGAGIDISMGGVISADDDSPTNEIQTLSILGNNLTLSNGGGTVAVPSGADGNGIYGGSGTLPANVNVKFESSRVLSFNNTGFGGNEFMQFRDSSIFGFSEMAFFRNGDKKARIFWGDSPVNGIYISSSNGDGSQDLLLSNNSFGLGRASTGLISVSPVDSTLSITTPKTLFKVSDEFGLTSTVFPAIRPVGSASFWQHNTDGSGAYVIPGAMTVTNPVGGSNTLQAALDSIADLAASAGVNGNGIFDAANNNDTIRVTTTNLNSAWNINNNTSGYIRINRPSAAFANGLLFRSPGGITGTQVHTVLNSERMYLQDRLDEAVVGSSFDLVLQGDVASGDFSQLKLKAGVAEFTTSNGGRLRLVDAGLTSSVTLAAPVIPTPYTLTLPTNDGNAGQFLQTDGSGVTTWASPAAPLNVGGISRLHTGASYSYNADLLGESVNALTLGTSAGNKVGLQTVSSAGGTGIQATFGGTATCQITGFVTLQDVSGDTFYLQVYVNGSPIYANVYASAVGGASIPKSCSISHLADLNNNDIVTIRIHSTDGNPVTILSAGLTVVKTQ